MGSGCRAPAKSSVRLLHLLHARPRLPLASSVGIRTSGASSSSALRSRRTVASCSSCSSPVCCTVLGVGVPGRASLPAAPVA
eukprot:354646-Alexandrium_andersonii.AAC.1